jgi:hypothetical protein
MLMALSGAGEKYSTVGSDWSGTQHRALGQTIRGRQSHGEYYLPGEPGLSLSHSVHVQGQSSLSSYPHSPLPVTAASPAACPLDAAAPFCFARHMTGGDIITIDLRGSAGAEQLSFCSALAFRAPRADPKALAHDCTLVILPPPFVRVAPILSCDMTEDCFDIPSRLMFLASPIPASNLLPTT